jgi:hypothetical protein
VLGRGLSRSAVDDVRYIVGIYDKDAGPDNQRLYLNGARVAQMSDTLPIENQRSCLRHRTAVSGIADPFIGHIEEFCIARVQRSDGWIATTWNKHERAPRVRSSRGRGAGRRRGACLPAVAWSSA